MGRRCGWYDRRRARTYPTSRSDLLRENNDRLAEIEVLDTGKPIQEASVVDIQTGADVIEYYAGLADKIQGDYQSLNAHQHFYTRREPLGVCVGIGAWNYPIQIACWKAGAALAAGNAMVFKPSEETPSSAVELAQILVEAGIPAGVFNVVQGDGRVGQMLTGHLMSPRYPSPEKTRLGRKSWPILPVA